MYLRCRGSYTVGYTAELKLLKYGRAAPQQIYAKPISLYITLKFRMLIYVLPSVT
jgi:hypothetical protein